MNQKETIVSLRLPVDLANEIRKSAAANDRSMSAELRFAARRHVAASKGASAGQAA
jgi:hypothetical protein